MSQGRKSYDDPYLVNHAISYTFRNQLPVSVSIYTGPYGPYQEENGECGLRAGSVDHAEDDAEPGRAVRRVYVALIRNRTCRRAHACLRAISRK